LTFHGERDIIKTVKQEEEMMMGSLYEITQEFLEFQKQLEEMDLEDELFKDTLDSAMFPIEVKTENIIKHIKTLEALADAKKLEAKRLSDSASSDLKKVEWFKNYLTDNLNKAGIKKLQAGVFNVGFRKGSEVVEVNEEEVPEAIARVGGVFRLKEPQPPKLISKTEIKKILKEHPEIKIPGVSLVRKPDTLTVK
jgi:hypothetical protein